MKKRRSPQEKKILSYVHDRRNMYGESRSASIKSIRKRKNIVNRQNRRVIAQQLHPDQEIEQHDETNENIHTIKRKRWQKYPDRSLVEYVENRWRRRRNYKMQAEPEPSDLMMEAKRRLRKKREIIDLVNRR